MTKPAPAKRARKRLSRWQARLVLLGFSLFVSLLVLGGVEGACRLAGYGGYPSTFEAVGELPGGSTLVMTRQGGPSSYFFTTRSKGGSFDPTALVMPKPADTVRIVVAGGSAAKGSPWPRNLAAAGFLQAMLADCWPDKKVEVINIGTTAVASYPVLGMTTEALSYQPDLVVAYLGNNEYYGAYGVASLHSAGRSPTMIRLIRAARSLGVAQFIDAHRKGYDASDPRTLMEAMVGRASIGPDDPAREAAARNLGVFVGDLVDRCNARHVPVIVCPPSCNESGLAPLGVPDRSKMDPGERDRLVDLLEFASMAVGVGDFVTARQYAQDALSIDADDALGHYLLGAALSGLGEDGPAAAEFRLAVDLDPMPWRPPGSSVDAVRRAGLRDGAVLCDLPAIFRAASPGGAVGWDLMADHVHPTLRGQALIARSVVDAMAVLPGKLNVPRGTAGVLAPWEDYARRLGASVYDEYASAHAMRTLGKIPFYEASNPELFERFDAECRQIEAGSPPEAIAAIGKWLDPATHKGEWRPINGLVAQALFGRGAYERAEPLFDAARRSVTPYGAWELQYAAFTLICRAQVNGGLDQQDRELAREMIAHGRFVIAHGWSESGTAERYTAEMLAMLGEHAEAVELLLAGREKMPEEGRVAVDGDLVRSYLAMGRFTEAEAVARAGLDAGGRFAPYYMQMSDQVRAARGGG